MPIPNVLPTRVARVQRRRIAKLQQRLRRLHRAVVGEAGRSVGTALVQVLRVCLEGLVFVGVLQRGVPRGGRVGEVVEFWFAGPFGCLGRRREDSCAWGCL